VRFNPKVILLGGLGFYLGQFALSLVTGPLLHEGVLKATYMAHSTFWRPELNQQPPDMAALMPRWITVGLIMAFVLAAIFDNIRPAFRGSGWLQGAKYGVVLFLIGACISAGWSGIFNLPDSLWVWWNLEALGYYVVGGTILGWVTAKFSSE
jgi:hypothetical protein